MKHSHFPLLLATLCAAFWPMWAWFITGTLDASNDTAGLMAAVAAIAIVYRAPNHQSASRPLLLPGLCLGLYLCAILAGLPLAVRGVLMAVAIAALASAFRMGRRLDPALLALSLLALPMAATLQFYFGYPLRVLAGDLSVILLRLNGMAVLREGATLAWNGQAISIDAPCSGLKMLWAALFIASALAALARLTPARTSAAVAIATLVVVLANALRTSALFYTESGLVILPAWTHTGIGVVCFVFAACSIAGTVQALKGKQS